MIDLRVVHVDQVRLTWVRLTRGLRSMEDQSDQKSRGVGGYLALLVIWCDKRTNRAAADELSCCLEVLQCGSWFADSAVYYCCMRDETHCLRTVST
jgi:hypothetical protein